MSAGMGVEVGTGWYIAFSSPVLHIERERSPRGEREAGVKGIGLDDCYWGVWRMSMAEIFCEYSILIRSLAHPFVSFHL